MYKGKDRKTVPLFEELFPFGGKLDENNRWLRISELIPWDKLETKYSLYFSEIGRPGLDSRLVVGLFLLKHMSDLSDKEVVLELQENPYWQAFCGLEHFASGSLLNDSSLSKLRKRLGTKYFKELEEETYKVLVERKIIKAKGMLVDATVFPENVKRPNDVGLLNDARQWLVDNLKYFGKKTGKQYRTYCRKAKKVYLEFSKKRRKTKKDINRTKKQMLQYVIRNINQMHDVIEKLKQSSFEVSQKVRDKLQTAMTIYSQQFEMYKKNIHRVKDRIVSFHRPYVRPVKRGKMGKDVEFGPKASLTHVDGFLFLDYFSHDNYSEAKTEVVEKQIKDYWDLFGRKPPSLTGDKLYGNRENRGLLKDKEIKDAFCPLGRKKNNPSSKNRWFKKKQKERNRIEGHFGNGKEHYGLDRIKYNGVEGAELWVRAGIMAMNLKTALKRM